MPTENFRKEAQYEKSFFIPWYSSLSLYFSFLFPPVCMSLLNKSFLRHDSVPLNTQEKGFVETVYREY